jgi:acetolactate synthase-1/3 small subunit
MDSLTPQQILRKQMSGEALENGEGGASHRHVIVVLLENTIGALNRVVNMFSARGFNLESVSVGETSDPAVSRMTIVTTGNDRIIGQVIRQLDNLVDTRVVDDVTTVSYVERELALVKVGCDDSNRGALMDIVNIFRGKVVNVTPDSLTFELTGPTTKINAFIGMLTGYTVHELARSGRVAMRRDLVFEDGKTPHSKKS